MLKNIRAFTLVELLICLSILALISAASLPSLTYLVEKNQTRQTSKKFLHAINFARTTAITRNSTVTFCKSDNGLECQGQWNEGSIVFIDKNSNAQIDFEDEIVLRVDGVPNMGTVRWRAFQNKAYLQMTPLGYTNYQNGNFTFCPADKDLALAQQIVINRTGRIRIAVDSDGDGIKEKSNGDPIKC